MFWIIFYGFHSRRVKGIIKGTSSGRIMIKNIFRERRKVRLTLFYRCFIAKQDSTSLRNISPLFFIVKLFCSPHKKYARTKNSRKPIEVISKWFFYILRCPLGQGAFLFALMSFLPLFLHPEDEKTINQKSEKKTSKTMKLWIDQIFANHLSNNDSSSCDAINISRAGMSRGWKRGRMM